MLPRGEVLPLAKQKPGSLLFTVFFGILWIAAVAGGGRLLLNYETTPGEVGDVPQSWPSRSSVSLAPDRPTLVMIAHPQCPCTRASAAELAQLMARLPNRVRAFVLFYTPRDVAPDWQESDLRKTVAQISGITVVSDIDGLEARRFGAETSGHTFLFDVSGRLLFNGGITASRGHSGDNVGESAIVSILNQGRATRQTSVFGCSFHEQALGSKGALCLK